MAIEPSDRSVVDDGYWGIRHDRVAERLWLSAFLVLALAFRLVLVIFLPSLYHPDETFQYWEQGYRLAFGTGVVPWEYRLGIRSWILPGFLAGVMRLVAMFGGGAEVWRPAIQILLASLSLSIVVTAYLWARRVAGFGAALLAGFLASFWFEFAYFATKPLTESVAGSLLFPATYLLVVRGRPAWHYVLGAVLLALALVLRVHLAPVVALIALVFAWQHPPRQWIGPFLGGLVVVLFAGALDWASWGSPFQSFWMSFRINLIEGKAIQYGQLPFFGYLLFLGNAWAGAVVVILALAALGARRSPLLATIPLLILLVHSLIDHKEYRFLYPALPFVFTLVAIGSVDLLGRIMSASGGTARRAALFGLMAAWFLTSVSLGGSDGFRTSLLNDRAEILAFQRAGAVENLCGLGLAEIHWYETPGTAGLGRAVPIYVLSRPADATELAGAYNVVVYPETLWVLPPEGYGVPECELDLCVAARPGACTPVPDRNVNATLIRDGE